MSAADQDMQVSPEQVSTLLAEYNDRFYDGELVFDVDVRAFKRRAGQYHPERQEIAISEHLLTFSPDTVKTVLKHELGHAAVHQRYDGDVKPHGVEWQNEMQRMGVEDADVTHDLQLVAYRYVFECTGCGRRTGRHRRSKFVKQTERYRCRECGERFEQIQ